MYEFNLYSNTQLKAFIRSFGYHDPYHREDCINFIQSFLKCGEQDLDVFFELSNIEKVIICTNINYVRIKLTSRNTKLKTILLQVLYFRMQSTSILYTTMHLWTIEITVFRLESVRYVMKDALISILLNMKNLKTQNFWNQCNIFLKHLNIFIQI